MLSDLVFYPEGLWLDLRFEPGIVVGKSFDVFSEEGSRIWLHMQASRVVASPNIAADPGIFQPLPVEGSVLEQTTRKARPARGVFSALVMDAYDWQCCVTREHTVPVIDAAHIQPYINKRSDHIGNGLALRKDIHTLFDRGYVGVDENYRFIVSPRLETEWHNGRVYYDFHEKPIYVPGERGLSPSRSVLKWHMDNVFLG